MNELTVKTFEVPVRGVKAMNVNLSVFDEGEVVELKKERSNRADPEAVVVLSWNAMMPYEKRVMGYLPRDLAARMSDPSQWHAVISKILWFEGKPSGLRLRVTRREGR